MRPDEWAATTAWRWNYYSQLRIAYEDGRDYQKSRKGDEGEIKKGMSDFLKKHGVG